MVDMSPQFAPLPSDAYKLGHAEGALMACDVILRRHVDRHEPWREAIRQVREMTRREVDRLTQGTCDGD